MSLELPELFHKTLKESIDSDSIVYLYHSEDAYEHNDFSADSRIYSYALVN
jgi:hypothetical protein